ncbi:MAG: YggS family pyridoxal phosphate-dependent enzyme [Acidimicrobiia bacterium]|nr:YggS family pyridoxal phosphate-dependent enzyme [Acidimicrobiia bacterium]
MVKQRIDAACAPDQHVDLVAVTKRFSVDVTADAVRAGCNDLGENYAQELEAKASELAGRGLHPRWHMIGPVQRNKVKKIVGVVHLWHSIDRVALLEQIASRQPGAAVLIQVNFTGEDTKSGAAPDEVAALVDAGLGLGLDVGGLMTMGFTDTSLDPRPVFARCRAAVDAHGLEICSMGMSGDFELAIAEGSTMVRVGSAIFGPRP